MDIKTKYLVLLALPYLTAYLLLFIIASKQSVRMEKKAGAGMAAERQKNRTRKFPDTLLAVEDTFAGMYKRP